MYTYLQATASAADLWTPFWMQWMPGGCILEVLGSSGARGFDEFQIGGPGCCLAPPFLIILMPLGSILDALDAFGGPFWRSWDHLRHLLKAFVATWCHLGYSGDPGSAKMSSRAGGSAVLL